MTNSGENEVPHQERSSAWCGVRGGQGECWWCWRSAEWNGGAKIQTKERWRGLRSAYPAEQPINAEQRWTGRDVTSLEWNRGGSIRGRGRDWGAPILEEERREKRQYGALNEIWKRHSRLRSADWDWGPSIIAEEYHWGGGGVSSRPTMCNCDECNGICSNSIYHHGRAKFTSIFILRKHNCNLLSSGILRQRTMNSCGHKR